MDFRCSHCIISCSFIGLGCREQQVLEDMGPGGQYQDPVTWHQEASNPLINLVGYIWEQPNQPLNWDNARDGVFEPSWLLLVPDIQVRRSIQINVAQP